MADKKLFKFNTIFKSSGNAYESNYIYKIEPLKMAQHMSSYREKLGDIKVKLRCTVVDKCDNLDLLVTDENEIVVKMGKDIASALQLESKIEYGEDLTCE